MVCLVVSSVDSSGSATVGWAVIWLNIVQLGCFVPIVRHIVISVILVVQRNEQQGHVYVRSWRYADHFICADDFRWHFSNSVEFTECVILVHAILLFKVVQLSEVRRQLSEWIKSGTFDEHFVATRSWTVIGQKLCNGRVVVVVVIDEIS